MNKCLNCGGAAKNKYCSISCQNIHQGAERANKKYGELKLFLIECGKCGVSFEVKERDKLFPQKDVYFCSKSCANSREHSEETRKQISLTLLKDRLILKNDKPVFKSGSNKPLLKPKEPNRTCINCKKEFYVATNKIGKFCSKSCCMTHRMNNGLASILGRKSVSVQSKNRRSKNEIYFAELCKQRFNVVKINEPMFNGWDADVIIEDLKLAVLWNGAWHYKKITKKHSVEKVQNRDKIKLKEIDKIGYKSYIIKDMGKYNKGFVENKFKEMLCYLKLIL